MIAKLFVVGAVLVVASATGVRMLSNRDGLLVESNAYMVGQVVHLAAAQPGRVQEVRVHRGQRVSAGDLLVALDPAAVSEEVEIQIEVLRQAVRQEMTRCLGLRSGENRVAALGAEARFREEGLARAQQLYERQMISKSDLERATTEFEVTRNEHDARRSELEADAFVARGPVLAHATVRAEIGRLGRLLRRRADLHLRASADGYVYEVLVFPGEYAQEGERLVVLVPDEELMVEANVLESRLSQVQVGAGVEVIPDVGGGGVKLQGQVYSIAPAVASTFSPLPRNNATSNWIKVTQRVPVLIRVSGVEPGLALPIGSSVQVRIGTVPAGEALLQSRSTATPDSATARNPWEGELDSVVQAVVDGERRRLTPGRQSRCVS
jgi:membrane fusion protein, multidrug efflux system